MNVIALTALFVIVPVVFALFALLPPRRAVIASFLLGYLFLPEYAYRMHTLPDVNKASITAVAVILASLLFDGGRLFTVRPRLLDIPWLVLCLSPIATSHVNGLGLMDGLACSANRICTWGLAYWIGRSYFTDWAALRDLAVGLVLGGLAYVPFCWWEIRMSPQLHGQFYGVTFLSFRTDANIFGYRPNVFLSNGLTVTMFMGMTALTAFWLWMSGATKKMLGLPMSWIFVLLFVTAVFCKALGGLTLMFAGMAALTMIRWPQTKMAVLALIVAAPTYMLLRATSEWSGSRLVEIASLISKERANSLEFRMKTENALAYKAMEQPWLGWGGWSRSHVYNEYGRDMTLVDGLWIILLGEYGIVGLAAFTSMVLGAAFMFWLRVPRSFWLDPAVAGAAALAVVITLYMVDGLFNATFNPVACLAVGAVASISGVAAAAFTSRKPSTVLSSYRDLQLARPAYRV
jgi:hypothetical protein